jgi:steroid delta-isomerase-like uncharacterized protein
MTTGQGQDVAGIAETIITAFSNGDWAQFRAPLAPNVLYEETGTGRHTESADAYVQLVQAWKQAFPDATGTIRNVVASGNTVVQEVVWEGTQTGDMATPGGVLPASGKRITVRASVWYTFQGATIQEVHHHLDIMTMLQQLGAIPAPGQGSAAWTSGEFVGEGQGEGPRTDTGTYTAHQWVGEGQGEEPVPPEQADG